MARKVEKSLVEVFDGWSVMMTKQEQQLWGVLCRFPFGDVVPKSVLVSELGVSENHFFVLKSHLSKLLEWGVSIVKQGDGYVVSRLR